MRVKVGQMRRSNFFLGREPYSRADIRRKGEGLVFRFEDPGVEFAVEILPPFVGKKVNAVPEVTDEAVFFEHVAPLV
jgi:hypothetical protein